MEPTQPLANQPRREQVYAALHGVLDPELDRSVVELGFTFDVSVVDDTATVTFRLPTFWCSASFAWIMAEDMRLALGAVPGLRRAEIRLVDHFASDKINQGIAGGLSFRETFLGEAEGDLAGIAEETSARPLVDRYLELRAYFGGPCQPGDAAFRTAEGETLMAARLTAYLRDIRMTRRGVEANGEMCRILLAERYEGSGRRDHAEA